MKKTALIYMLFSVGLLVFFAKPAFAANFGSGNDGDITVSANTIINTVNSISGRVCSDGGDAVNYSVVSFGSDGRSATLSSSPSSGCLNPGDEVLIINLQGTSSYYSNVGNYETLVVSSVSGNVVNFTNSKGKYYGNNSGDDTNIETATSNQRVMLQRIPNYRNVTVNASRNFYPSSWNGIKGGVIFFRVSGSLIVNGSIHANGVGYRGGERTSVGGYGGESFCALRAGGTGGGRPGGDALCGGGGGGKGNPSSPGGLGSLTGGAGGGGAGGNFSPGGGAGGGYGTAASGASYDGRAGGVDFSGNGGNGYYKSYAGGGGGGGTYGDANLTQLFFGSGGGAGGSNVSPSGSAGRGGGIVFISANSYSGSGNIRANGGGGSKAYCDGNCYCYSGSGGGAGGSVMLQGDSSPIATVTVTGGAGGAKNTSCDNTPGKGGAAGGLGRMLRFSCIEDNSTPSAPSSVSLSIDGISYPLSSNGSSPTMVKRSSTLNNTQMVLPEISFPTESGGLYSFLVGGSTYEDSANEVEFPGELVQGASGSIIGKYSSKNNCDDGRLDSPSRTGYYIVNRDPVIIPTDPDSECEIGVDEECTKREIFRNIGTDITSMGCSSDYYTGKDVNNPLDINISSIDPNSINDINGVILWFHLKDSENPVPEVVSTSGEYSSSSVENIGIMIRKNWGSWSSTPIVYGINGSLDAWRVTRYESDGSVKLKVRDGDSFANMASITDISVVSDTQVRFRFKLEFIPNSISNPSGMYEVYATVLDSYMASGNIVDQSYMSRYFDWGIDLEDPEQEKPEETILGPQRFDLDLSSLGTGSRITDLVLNGYRAGGFLTQDISLVNPSGYSDIRLEGLPDEDKIGVLGVLNSWHFNNLLGLNTPQNGYDSKLTIDIGTNEGGSILMYSTVFDEGCNYNTREYNVDLNPWIATRGGVVYTQGSLGSDPKNLSEEQIAQSYGLGGGSTLRTFTLSDILEKMNSGTELISSRRESVSTLRSLAGVSSVRANFIYDSNDRKDYWFEYYKKRFEVQRGKEGVLTEFTTIGNSVSSVCTGDNCYYYSESDIVIPSGYSCDSNAIFISEGNITINPQVESSGDGIEGCIFLANNDIILPEDDSLPNSAIVRYEYMNGFLIAGDQVIVQPSSVEKIVRNGIEIKGGVVAFGRDSTDSVAFLIQRSLRLFNRTNPSVVLVWDVRYGKLSEIFFGTEAPMYKQDVGFKVF